MCTPMLVTISVYRGHEDFRDQTALASALVERWHMAPGVQRIEVRERGVQGTLFVPPGKPVIPENRYERQIIEQIKEQRR